MSTTERERFRTYFEYAYCKKMLDGEFESYDIDERIRRIADDFFKGKKFFLKRNEDIKCPFRKNARRRRPGAENERTGQQKSEDQ